MADTDTASFGPVDVDQRAPYREYQRATCGTVSKSTVSCPADQFETSTADCVWGPDQRKCSFPDERLCWQVPDWAQWSTGTYRSGSTLGDAKVRCQWDNVPRRYMTKANVELFERVYGKNNQAYDDAMAGFCLKQTRKCMLDPDTGLPMSQCANVHSGDKEVQKTCSDWWNDIKGTRRGDDFITEACPEGSFGLRGDCSCALASTESADYQAIQAKYTGFPARCWYRPCADGSTRSQFRPSSHESATCEGAICITKNEISADMAKFIDAVVVQEAQCNINQQKGEFTVGSGTSGVRDDGQNNAVVVAAAAAAVVVFVVVVMGLVAANNGGGGANNNSAETQK